MVHCLSSLLIGSGWKSNRKLIAFRKETTAQYVVVSRFFHHLTSISEWDRQSAIRKQKKTEIFFIICFFNRTESQKCGSECHEREMLLDRGQIVVSTRGLIDRIKHPQHTSFSKLLSAEGSAKKLQMIG